MSGLRRLRIGFDIIKGPRTANITLDQRTCYTTTNIHAVFMLSEKLINFTQNERLMSGVLAKSAPNRIRFKTSVFERN